MSEYIVEVEGQMPDAIFERELTEIVRCRDCRYYEETGNCNWFECSSCWLLAEVTPYGFCAWGERREQ